MARRARLAPLGVSALLLIAGLGTVGGVATDENRTESTEIRVNASGEVEGEPDQAILRVAVIGSARDAGTVRDRLAENATRMRAALREANVGDERVRTVSFDIGEERDREGEPTGFRGVHAFEITLDDTDRVGEVIDTAVNNGANEVEGVAFTLSNARRDELRATALREAMTRGRSDADAIAGAANLTITGVTNVSTEEQLFVPAEAELTAADAEGGTTVESGPVTVSARVVVTYRARPA